MTDRNERLNEIADRARAAADGRSVGVRDIFIAAGDIIEQAEKERDEALALLRQALTWTEYVGDGGIRESEVDTFEGSARAFLARFPEQEDTTND